MIRSSDLFDGDWYRRTYPDVAASGMDPAVHFLRFGVRESRKAGLVFDEEAYLARYPDVARSGMHPLLHYLRHGRSEGRPLGPVPPNFMLEVRLPADKVRSLALPFTAPSDASAPRIAVLLHLYYADLADEFLERLACLPGRADLFVTTTTALDRDRLQTAFSRWQAGAVQVMQVQNRGRDVAPKFVSLAHVHDDYELCLHLHGKKSLHWPHGTAWRRQLLDCLVGDAATVRSILAAFAADPRLGVIFPKPWAPLECAINWGHEYERAEALARRMGIHVTPETPLEFAAGSMFWARSAALRPLLELGLRTEDFPVEDGLHQQGLAHTIERLVLHACEAAGYRWISVSRDEAGARDLLRIGDASELPGILESRGYPLLVAPRRCQRDGG